MKIENNSYVSGIWLKTWSFTNNNLPFQVVIINGFLIFRFFPLEKGSARSHPELRGVRSHPDRRYFPLMTYKKGPFFFYIMYFLL